MRVPQFSSDLPYVPMNFQDRDNLVGRLMEVLEAVMPQGTQLEATKSLMKQKLSEYFTRCFNDAYHVLKDDQPTIGGGLDRYIRAIWEVSLTDK